MSSDSNQQGKQQRRKRKDPESRDFVCQCGKSYLSYAAAYTHVKNKHNGDNGYLNNISKPNREKLKRGRPKEKKVFQVTSETEKLSIVEEAILQIYQALQKVKDPSYKIILQGNQQIRLEQLVNAYESLKKQMGDPGLKLFFDCQEYGPTGKMLTEFIQKINKHFVAQIAVKIIWLMNYVFSDQLRVDGEQQQIIVNQEHIKIRIKDETSMKLWNDVKQIPLFIEQALQKWIKTVEKQNEANQHHES